MRSHYDDLGIEPTATTEQISAAYRFLSQKFHPDLNRGREAEAQRRFLRVQAAFDVLSDDERRLRYDRELLLSLQTIADSPITLHFLKTWNLVFHEKRLFHHAAVAKSRAAQGRSQGWFAISRRRIGSSG
ncbi:MAG: J domain-containing protein [Candidatus Acidiferrales bacterium]